MIRRAGFAASLVLAALALLAQSALAAREKGRRMDLITTVPDFAACDVKSIALLPIATFDRSLPAERAIADFWGRHFKDTGYRRISAPTAREMLQGALVGSSGALLWGASGSETSEGPCHDPSMNPIGVSSTSLESAPITGQSGPPAFDEALNRRLLHWQPQFPPFTAAVEPAK
jgi:hypothetical protein